MIIDGLLVFDPANTPITVTATSTNVLDMLVNRDMGIGRVQGKILVLVQAGFASATPAATMNVQLQGAPDSGSGTPGTYQTILESGLLPLGQMSVGFKIAQFDIGVLADAIMQQALTTGTFAAASTAVTVGSAAGIFNGQFVSGAGIVPGTTVATGAGTTALVLSANTTAIGNNVPLTFLAGNVIPRFYRLNYVCSATMTAGQLQSQIVLDADEQVYYRPGYVVPN